MSKPAILLDSVANRSCRLAVALLLLLTVGCWEEIHYRPSSEPIKPANEPVVLESAQPKETEAPEVEVEPTAPAPSATELFAEEEGGETASEEPAVTVAAEPEKEATDKDPVWDALDSEEETTAVPEPAPPLETPRIAPDNKAALAAWRLGSKWSLAAGIYGKGYGPDRYGDVWGQAEREAEVLKVTLPPLPDQQAIEERLAAATTLLLDEGGPSLAADLGRRLSAEHQALFELANRSHALLLIYTPDATEVKPLIVAIRLSAVNSGLPEEMWAPLVELLDSRADFAAVKGAVFQLHKDAEAHLAEQVGR